MEFLLLPGSGRQEPYRSRLFRAGEFKDPLVVVVVHGGRVEGGVYLRGHLGETCILDCKCPQRNSNTALLQRLHVS